MLKAISTTVFLIFLSVYQGYSQTVNDIPIKDIDVEFVQIVGTSKLLSSQVTIQIDFGQRTKLFTSYKETVIRDEQGKPLVLNSMVDALNFMSQNGYDFVNAYALTIGNSNVYHFLLQKRKD